MAIFESSNAFEYVSLITLTFQDNHFFLTKLMLKCLDGDFILSQRDCRNCKSQFGGGLRMTLINIFKLKISSLSLCFEHFRDMAWPLFEALSLII